MKLSELIVAIGDENIAIQPLDECATNFVRAKDHTKITFCTKERFDFKGTVKFGFVVWLNRDELKTALEKTS